MLIAAHSVGPLRGAQPALTVPQGSEIFLHLGRELDPSKVRVEDKFYGDVAVPLTVDDQIVIPAGAQIVGRVAELGEEAGEFRVGLQCETLILPDNRRFQLSANLTAKEGDMPEEGDEAEQGVQGMATVDGAVRRGVQKGVDALVGWMGRKPKAIEKGTIITITLTRDLTIAPQP
ncbi:MAG TPA: hypothetical protein VLV83_11525 [Acidobacteriota bacterium]|nr:hypothetical protein [Acidobacteriota bacterium]